MFVLIHCYRSEVKLKTKGELTKVIEVIQSILQSEGAADIKAKYRDKLAMIVEVCYAHACLPYIMY